MSCNVIGKVKDKKILFEEIINKNRGYSKINNIKIIYQQIIEYYDKNMRSISIEAIEKKIKQLKSKIQKNPDDEKLNIELISIMIKANEIIFKYKPREIQIIAVLFFLFKEKNSGLIEEIYTGEGKTIIISFLAIIKAFQGKKVDILTSSLVLAERDSNEMRNFYILFGLSENYCKQDNREIYQDYFEIKKKKVLIVIRQILFMVIL
jgi:preprotein translocase subunit SecA